VRANAILLAKNGDYVGAGISALGAGLPFVGDFAKIGKISKDLKIIDDAIEASLKIVKKGGDEVAGAVKKVDSYTNKHVSGKNYHGKGPKSRADKSGQEKAKKYVDPVESTDWTPSKNEREAFKDENKRIQKDKGGVKSSKNYNQRESPGKKYEAEDSKKR